MVANTTNREGEIKYYFVFSQKAVIRITTFVTSKMYFSHGMSRMQVRSFKTQMVHNEIIPYF